MIPLDILRRFARERVPTNALCVKGAQIRRVNCLDSDLISVPQLILFADLDFVASYEAMLQQ